MTMLLFAKMRRPVIAICGFLFVIASVRGAELTAEMRREALKIIRFLDQVEAESLMGKSGPPRKMDFTESEFNSYIAYRIAAEKENVMRELRLKILDRNRIEGKIFLDLKGQKLPALLKPEMNLYFAGVLDTREGEARLDFQKLFLDDQQVPLMLLDLVVYVAVKLGKSDPFSLHDWYALPPGIKDIQTGAGRISVYY
jgi:hypothetical protein